MKEIRIFSPATVANVSCGFDVLGFCLDTIGDEMVVRITDKKGIHITKIEGYDLPFEAEKNVAGVSASIVENQDEIAIVIQATTLMKMKTILKWKMALS